MTCKYHGINYEEKVDCFALTADVKSYLLYGNLQAIEKPWITLVIPTHKRPGLLREALDSVLNQWHSPFFWDIIVVDNEEYDDKPNMTEKLICEIDNERILYYRNSKHLRPGDNFNRGIFLARGKYICMLHDDDLLVHSTIQVMGKLIKFVEKQRGKPLGAISTGYYTIKYDEENHRIQDDISGLNAYFCSLPTPYNLTRLTENNILFTSNIGGSLPSNGTTFLRQAVLDCGGFNDDYGISADLILFYNMEQKYRVYYHSRPFGLYRWGNNTSNSFKSVCNVIRSNLEFREYVYSKNIFNAIWGLLFRKSQYIKFAREVLGEWNRVNSDKLTIDDLPAIAPPPPPISLFI